MKKTVFIAILFAVFSLSSCMKEREGAQVSGGPTFHFATDPDSFKSTFQGRTEDGRYPVAWSENDKEIHILCYYNSAYKYSGRVPLEAEAGTQNAHFDVDLSKYGDVSYPIEFTALSPESAYQSTSTKSGIRRVSVDLFSAQTPLANSPDERTQIIIAKSESYEEGNIPGTIPMSFHHIPAYFLFTFNNVDLGTGASAAQVQSIAITTANTPIAGRFSYKVDSTEDTYMQGSSMTNTISLTTSSLENVWCSVAPTDLSNEVLTFRINTDKGAFSKTVTMPDKRALTSGKVYKLSVNMSGADFDKNIIYEQVTDFSTLQNNDQVIVVARNYDFALASTQNTNNRAASGVIKTGHLIINPPVNTEIITLGAGTGDHDGHWTLFATKKQGYLHAPNAGSTSGDNLLRTQDSPDENSYWTIAKWDEASLKIQRVGNEENHSTIGFNNEDMLFTAYNPSTIPSRPYRWVDLYRLCDPTGLSASLSVEKVSESEQDIQLYVLSDVASWTATVDGGAVFSGSGVSTSSGNNSAVLTIHVPAYDVINTAKTYTVTVSADGQTPVILTFKQYRSAVFPVRWSMPAENNVSGVDYALNDFSGSYVYSDTHEGKLSVVRESTASQAKTPTTYMSRKDISGEERWGEKYCLLHYGVYKEDYWQFEIYNVNNPAGTYTLNYCAESSTNGPKYFLFEYSTDGTNWTKVPGYSSTTFTSGDYSEESVDYHYYIATSATVQTVNQSVTLPALKIENLSIRARVTSASRVAGTKMPVNHGATTRIGDHVTISFSAN